METNNLTIEDAVKLIQSSTGTTSCKNKEIGFHMILLGLAEVNTLRIARLAPVVFQLEKMVFAPDVIQNIDPRGVVELYKLAVNAMTASAESVKATISNMNWETLELQLLSKSEDLNKKSTNGIDTTKLASELLLQLSSKSKQLLGDENVTSNGSA